ncbi:NAD+ kinase [Coprinopsis cinerea okayama7|uniref:NAD+ kinase n=1 Tax=Coprinopsis cinerea (strain Okayama-7 / 130 / ATCC MYA-4618 / FGSC 9003) TaxID=240176 RepID=A8N6L7_COPC7|nr:NAD+ kinase [Coprinopsis cinerea okayama7\|eukprot:XP_001830473.1 NAD+ kinase [Coprinopsis cinerea okayama7\
MHNQDPLLIRPSLSRKNSRPSSLNTVYSQNEYKPDIELEVTSPGGNGTTVVAANGHHDRPAQDESTAVKKPNPHHTPTPQQMVKSPCFVHSHLDKGADLTKFLMNKPYDIHTKDLGVAKSLQQAGTSPTHARFDHTATQTRSFSPESVASSFASGYEVDDEDEYIGSLTTQLAETAVSVREMSKQLGRARVQSNIQNVLIVTKARDNRLIKLTRDLALYLMLKRRPGQQRGLVVYVDSQLRTSRRFDAEGIKRDHPELFAPFPRRRPSSSQYTNAAQEFQGEEGQLRYWTSSMCSRNPHLFDFVITLGGDGTVLFTSWLFQKVVPPVLSFALGSLGFLTNFDFADHQAVMDSAIDNGIRVNLRMRFTCTVYRAVATEKGKGRKAVKKAETGEIIMKNLEKGGGWEALEGGWGGAPADGKCTKDKEIMCYTTRPVESFEVLNDLVVDRGPSPYVSLLELFGDDHHMTTVQADGLTISTPTGSTAYSLSAGGSLVHPEIPAILITPICPHTLSFRPMLLPDSMELRICVPYNSRSTAWASFDGRGRVELKQGDHIKVTASRYPFPTVCADKQSTDWFHAISRTLKWNERERQKSFVVVEEGPAKPKRRKRSRAPAVSPGRSPKVSEMDEEDEEDDEASSEEDDKFDIDDSSAAESDSTTDAGVQADDFSHLRPPSMATVKDSSGSKRTKRGKSRSKSRPRTVSTQSQSSDASYHSGVDSPSRYASPGPHLSHGRHVEFSYPDSNQSSPSSESGLNHSAQQGMRDDLHLQRSPSGRSRIPKDRDIGAETPKTATVPLGQLHGHGHSGRGRGHSISKLDNAPHRAFAVWGHDESDSNASDSDL